MENKEIRYWNRWNVENRAGKIDQGTTAGLLGDVVVEEVRSLSPENARMLEIACGTGWLAERIQGYSSYLGLDISPKSIEIAKQRVPGAQFVAADFLSWDSGDAQFDFVFLIDAFNSIRDQDKALEKIVGLVSPGGYFVLTCINPFVYSRISWVGAPQEGQFRKWLPKSEVRAMLEKAGFSILRLYSTMPAGDRGVLRFINSRILNSLAKVFISEERLRRFKEKRDLGQYLVAVAERK